MGRYLAIATAGAGGDLQPLLAAGEALRARGHEVRFSGDASVGEALAGAGFELEALPADLDLGPRLIAAVREAVAAGGDQRRAGEIVQARLRRWAEELAPEVTRQVAACRPDALVTSLVGVEALQVSSPPQPWAAINSTFYIGSRARRPIELDVAPRAIPIMAHYGSLLEAAPLVLHATDQAFDFGFEALPANHRYVGPLGIWEAPAEAPPGLDEPGPPWALLAISSQLQDDLPLAATALAGLGGLPVRVLATTGAHDPADLGPAPPNALVLRNAPHAAVLARAALLVGHAGHGTVLKALWQGVPMVLVPWGRDQPGVAARAQALGVADVVPREKASPERVREAAGSVLADSAMRAAAERHSSRLRGSDPPAVAAALLAGLLG